MNHHVNRVQDEYDNIASRQHSASVKMEEGGLIVTRVKQNLKF